MSAIEHALRFGREQGGSAKRSIDRRVARTRALLHQGFLALILEKGYDAITVEDICERANVGRSTFYGHFTGKDDLKRSGLAQLRQELLNRRQEAPGSDQPAAGRLGFSLPMFEHARDHMQHYRALVGSKGGAIALDTIRQTLCEILTSELGPTTHECSTGIPREFVVQHIVGAYMAVLVWWLDRGAKLAPDRIDAMFQCLATEGLQGALSGTRG